MEHRPRHRAEAEAVEPVRLAPPEHEQLRAALRLGQQRHRRVLLGDVGAQLDLREALLPTPYLLREPVGHVGGVVVLLLPVHDHEGYAEPLGAPEGQVQEAVVRGVGVEADHDRLGGVVLLPPVRGYDDHRDRRPAGHRDRGRADEQPRDHAPAALADDQEARLLGVPEQLVLGVPVVDGDRFELGTDGLRLGVRPAPGGVAAGRAVHADDHRPVGGGPWVGGRGHLGGGHRRTGYRRTRRVLAHARPAPQVSPASVSASTTSAMAPMRWSSTTGLFSSGRLAAYISM